MHLSESAESCALCGAEQRPDIPRGALVDEFAAEDSDVAEYVKALEESKDSAELPDVSGDVIAKEFERYLRRQSEG